MAMRIKVGCKYVFKFEKPCRAVKKRNIPISISIIINALKELGYDEGGDFETEYKILELVGEDGKTVLKVDFYLPALKTMIEFDGEYHFRKGGHEDSENKLRKQIAYDKMKNKL